MDPITQPSATPAGGNDSGAATPSPSPAPAGGGTPGTPAEPFLSVNDRQVYKTRDEAVRAYQEAGTRIAELSPWEALAKEGFTPQQVQQYLDDLAQRIDAEKKAAAAPPSGEDVLIAAVQGDKAAYAKLSPEQQKQADQWIAHNAYLEKMGYVRKDALKPIQDQLQQSTQSQQQQENARLEQVRTNSETILNGLIKDSGIPLDEAGSRRIADSIEDSIVRASRNGQNNIIPNSPEDRLIRGDANERSTIIKEHFDWFNKFGESYAKRQTATLVDQKAAAAAVSPRPLPANSSPVPAPAAPGKGFRDTNLNKSVQAAMEAELARRGGGSLG